MNCTNMSINTHVHVWTNGEIEIWATLAVIDAWAGCLTIDKS